MNIYKEIFATQKEAKDALEAGAAEPASLGFCPVIRDKCLIDCLCYQGPYVGRGMDLKWRIYPGKCGHVLIDGTIYVEQN